MSWSSIKSLARDWLLAIAVVVALWFVWFQFFAPAPLSSGPAPDFDLAVVTGEKGERFQLADDDHLVVLNFWFTSCQPCRHEIPELTAYHQAHPEVPLYGVSIDRMQPTRLAAMSRKLGIDYPVLHDRDSRVSGEFGVSMFPTTVIVHEGKIARVRTGEVTQQSLEAMVASVHDH